MHVLIIVNHITNVNRYKMNLLTDELSYICNTNDFKGKNIKEGIRNSQNIKYCYLDISTADHIEFTRLQTLS